MAKQIISRVAAIFLLSFPMAYILLYFQQEDQKAFATLSRPELVAYLSAGFVNQQYVMVAIVFGFGLFYVGVVEGFAYVLRWAWQQFDGSKKPEEVKGRSGLI